MAKKSKLEERTGTSYAKEKRLVYRLVRDYVQRVTGARVAPREARAIFDLVIEEVMASAVRAGSFRFNGGHGVLHMHTYDPYPKKLPGGETQTVYPDPKLRHKAGRTTRALFEHGGDLEKAYAIRSQAAEEARLKDAKAGGGIRDEREIVPLRRALFEDLRDEAVDEVLENFDEE